MTMTPALERRRSDSAHTAALHSGGSDDAGTSKRKCAADDTLLTFCPPAPWARIIVNSISRSSRTRLSCIGSIASAIVARPGRTDERRVGKEGDSTRRIWGAPDLEKK